MKIMLCTRVWPTHRPGGMPHVCADRANALAAAGHEVHVVTTTAGTSGSRSTSLIHNEATCGPPGSLLVHYDGHSPAHQWSSEFADACISNAVQLEPDLVHSDSFDRARPWWWLASERRFPMAVTMHGFEMGGWLTALNLHRAFGAPLPAFPAEAVDREISGLRTADVVIGVSAWERRMLVDQYGLTDAKLVYNPIAPYFFEQPRVYKKREGFIAVAVSGAHQRGFHLAAEAAKLAGVPFRAIQDVPRHELPDIYARAAGLVVHTAYAQGYDLAVCEAHAQGCPVIYTPTGSYLDEAFPYDRMVPLGAKFELADVMADLTEEQEEWPTAHERFVGNDRHRPEEHVKAWLWAVAR